MKKKLILSLATFAFLFGGCQNEKVAELVLSGNNSSQKVESENRGDVVTPMGAAYSGKMIVKLKDSVVKDLIMEDFGKVQLQSVPKPLYTALTNIKATKISRLFPPAGKYEARSRKEGMHLWYKIDFEEDVNLNSALSTMASIDGVESVECLPIIEMMEINNPADLLNIATQHDFDREDNLPFNDPQLSLQWHYNNIGKVNGGIMGADINLFKAWEVTTGTNNVIVCVVDGGINIKHEDLKDNLWINETELNGETGKDDDGNGYVDDIYGYCFVADTGDILPDDDAHGTHVSGTIGARNNNGTGVAGVAGGDGTPGSGIRLQSAAIFRKGYMNGGDGAVAIKYGADNGAVISQNSWGYPYKTGVVTTPPSLKAAIDYFTKYAGCDENGNQLPDSPMKGGLVIFAAGNDNVEYNSQPSAYEKVVAVASMGPDFKKASYSTYGKWVDITAPGGDQERFGTRAGVLSTLAKEIVGTDYGFYQGTSMACPHVSGVAALVVSYLGGPGFTCEDLRERLLSTVMPIDINEKNPKYSGKLGRGYIDAYAALTLVNKKIAPDTPKFNVEKTNEADFTSITVYWNVPSDEDDGSATKYQLYYSSEQLTASNFIQKGILVGPSSGFISGLGLAAGKEMSYSIRNLNPDTEYYFALVAYDRWGLASKPAFHSTKTKINTPPEIINVPEEPILLLDILGFTTYDLEVKDIDGHSWSYDISGDIRGVTHTKTENSIKINIRPILSEGDYTFKVQLEDELKAVSEYEIPFRIISVNAPVMLNQIPDQLIGINNDPVRIKLADYFESQEYFDLIYSATVNDESMISTTLDDTGIITLKGVKPGKTIISVEVSNGHKTTHTNFKVSVVDDINKDVYSVWPLPIRTDLNIWVNPKYKIANVKLVSVSGEVVFDENITTNVSGIAKVNMKKVAPGSYTLRVEAGNNPFIKAVLKR